ncbi:pilus assembly PilX N-terminal domain-containing protein [Bacillus sp. ISL-35]|uniref:hypothetical protein n=1 Tax=Bacillus sp. ISL-35 TaxID=2819122 RepID=UPI001BEA3FC8|nr:hypothetical protein [Bacillus sp. ISL-35]MBT2681648.1 pilus assembly PilX N-terminal domain-containing protein [Bacillus sp. ISL-35]MBT2702316.1 pilus assembly PilX N-terminal domain-containing protein [Chryseobacterium sp. ISL-80]
MSKNEQGSVLLVVLLMMTVFSIIGITLVGMAANNSKQIAHTGSEIKATNLAEMGVTHMKKQVTGILSRNSKKSLDYTVATLNNELPFNKSFNLKLSQSYPMYRIENIIVSPVKSGEQEKISIAFTSIGIAEDHQESRISGKMIVSRGFLTGDFPQPTTEMKPSDEESIKSNHEFASSKLFLNNFSVRSNTDLSFKKDAYFQNGLETESNTHLEIGRDLYLKEESSIKNNSDVWVKGNAHIKSLSVKQNNPERGNQGLICIEGTLYLYGDEENISVKTPIPSCAQIIDSNHESGIYAMEVVNVSETPEPYAWDVKDLLLEASYQ